MLAIKPTNLSHDIAPAWLVSEAALFAQGEHKRRERAKAQRGDGKGSGGQAKGSKGGGRGRGDKRPKGGKVPPTGGQPAVAALVKSAKVDAMGYATVSKTHAQVPMDASRIVEPSDERVVDMLQALPQDEREFYAHEENVVELLGKSSVIQQELEQQYAFVGGSLDEYLKYFHRQDIPTNMWEWKRFRDVKAVAGFSVVPKKDGRSQRKLLMCCSFNYLLCDPRNRSSLGMQGAGALTRIHVAAGDKLELAACDQSNAFTRVAVPTWMIPYLAAPPITAAAVWDLLPDYLRATISESDLVSPCYKRLPMGCSHSVHILMMINLQVIGRSLRANALVGTGQHDTPPVEEPNTQTVTSGCDHAFHGYNDDEWWSRFQVGVGRRFESGYSVQEWWDAIRAARSSSDRTIVVMYFFGGERRDGDVQEHVEKLAAEANLKVLMITVDLGCDSRWDVAQPETFHEIMRMLEGYVDIIVGGPPCSTVSRARHRRGGLTTAESGRLREANRLWLHFMMACEKVSARGGCHLFEHPQDPGVEPFPSIWITPEMIQLELRTKAQRVSFDQCACGAPVKKGTTVSGTLDGIGEFERFQCPGVGPEHLHSGHATGLDARGSFRSRRLQAYPQAMCELLARCIVKSARRMVAEGDRICMVAKYKHVQLASEVTVLRAVIGLWSFGAQLRVGGKLPTTLALARREPYGKLFVGHTSPLLSGFATEEYSRDCHVADIRQRGRWASEQSFKTYLDVVSAAHVQSAFHLRGVGQAQAYSETHFADFFPSGVFKSSHG
ncbi:unnamed protein product [Symbiodinium microadriaticum]|nr:unnamed protein product [Symbiodinium microadriaticum]